MKIKITKYDISQAIQNMENKKTVDLSELSEISQKLFNNFKVTDEEIAKAFKLAKEQISKV